jgi:hypothetical protein
MMVLRLSPVILSALLLSAHFSRHDLPLLSALTAAFPLVLLVRRSWVPSLTRWVLVLGTLEWVRTLFTIARQREAAGDAWLRMAVILGFVAAVTLASATVFTSQRVRERYQTQAP